MKIGRGFEIREPASGHIQTDRQTDRHRHVDRKFAILRTPAEGEVGPNDRGIWIMKMYMAVVKVCILATP